MVLVIGFLLLVSLLLSTILAIFSNWMGHFFPALAILGQILNFTVSFVVITGLFAAIYKMLPDVRLPWKHLWVGSIIASLLFNIGKFLIGTYLGSSGMTSSYGAAASLAIVLIWVFYSAQILLTGAEFTKVYSLSRRGGISPTSRAMLTKL